MSEEQQQIRVSFPGNKKVYAHYKSFEVQTDQPQPFGDGTAPSPFDLFLSSLATCAGIFVLGFCQKRKLNTEGLEIIQTMTSNPETHMVSHIKIEIKTPKDFPDQYKNALIQTASLCAVKKHMAQPPEFDIVTV